MAHLQPQMVSFCLTFLLILSVSPSGLCVSAEVQQHLVCTVVSVCEAQKVSKVCLTLFSFVKFRRKGQNLILLPRESQLLAASLILHQTFNHAINHLVKVYYLFVHLRSHDDPNTRMP